MRIAFSLPLPHEDRLAPDVLRHGHDVVARCSTAHELASRVEPLRPDLVIVAATPRHLTESLLAICDDAGVRVLALVDGDGDGSYARAVGLLETVPADADWARMQETLSGLIDVMPTWTAPVEESHRGTVVAVWGPAGAPGRTTLAINIAAEIAAAGYSVALCDVDTYSGSIAPALGMLDESPGFAAACRLAGADALTLPELERIGQQYPSAGAAFWVLTGIGRPSRWPELSAARVAGTIAKCREWVDYVVLDTGFNLEAEEEISSDLMDGLYVGIDE